MTFLENTQSRPNPVYDGLVYVHVHSNFALDVSITSVGHVLL